MQELFSLAMKPPAHVVLGMRLRPLTLGHAWLLHTETDMFNDNDPTLGSLIAACLICGRDYRKYRTNKRSLGLKMFLAWWGMRCRKIDFGEQLLKFAGYIQENCKQAEWITESKRMRTLSSPWHIRMVAMLMSHLNMTKDEAMSTEVLQGTALIACVTECDGDVDLWSDEQDKLWQMASQGSN